MSTQVQAGIPFSVAQDQQAFRLLELPDEILELLSTPNPPVLHIKSQDPSSLPPGKQAHAHLCTPTSTYRISQIQTSNSVHVTCPVTTSSDSSEVPIGGISAIATCTATLNLDKVVDDPTPSLKQMLRLYDGSRSTDSFSKRGKADVFGDIPFSDAQLERVWTSQIAFEHNGVCARPTTDAALRLWRSVFAAATAEGIDLTTQFYADDLWKATEEDDAPKPLLEALIKRLGAESSDSFVSLSKADVLMWTGLALLEEQTTNSGQNGVERAKLLLMWKGLVPERWHDDVHLDLIKAYIIQPTSNTVAFRASADEAPGTASSGEKKPAAGARRWHEKFKRNKN
ncbi:hypothetical protein LTS18_008275 [Coniosporium uncinatum]|uniref:Uncharacterized protein n=1 Tax=Coniosporium uncinatum TaxID=93489 RepID=A0ACC3DN81_9PEZI|nr:hypothetical protein LTS18_008275 [Coniosporium uncinatum]